jgi:hypothetical protein
VTATVRVRAIVVLTGAATATVVAVTTGATAMTVADAGHGHAPDLRSIGDVAGLMAVANMVSALTHRVPLLRELRSRRNMTLRTRKSTSGRCSQNGAGSMRRKAGLWLRG